MKNILKHFWRKDGIVVDLKEYTEEDQGVRVLESLTICLQFLVFSLQFSKQ